MPQSLAKVLIAALLPLVMCTAPARADDHSVRRSAAFDLAQAPPDAEAQPSPDAEKLKRRRSKAKRRKGQLEELQQNGGQGRAKTGPRQEKSQGRRRDKSKDVGKDNKTNKGRANKKRAQQPKPPAANNAGRDRIKQFGQAPNGRGGPQTKGQPFAPKGEPNLDALEDGQKLRRERRQKRKETREERRDKRRDARQKRKEERQDALRDAKQRGEKRRDARQERREDRREARRNRIEDIRKLRRRRSEAGGKRLLIDEGDRTIVKEGRRTFIRGSDGDRLRRKARRVETERRGNRQVTRVYRPNGSQIITIRDRHGRILRRVRRTANGREIVIINNTYRGRRRDRGGISSFWLGLSLPLIALPTYQYIVDAREASRDDLYYALSAPPVEELDDYYTLDEIRYNYPLRARMRSVDVNTINFDFGSWLVDPADYERLADIAAAMNRVIREDENEVFLVEGHTDAVGNEEDNLSLSDRRAESVAVILTDEFGVPPENIVTQGYGEQFLRVETQAPERRNRRVTVRRITPLMARGEDPDYSEAPYDEPDYDE